MFRSDTLIAALAFSALSVGCSSAEETTANNTSGAGGAGGTTSATTTADATTGATATGATATSAVASTTGAGGAPPMFVCDPPAEPGSLWEIEDISYDLDAIDPVSMCKYRGDVLLIVNTAAV